MKRIILYILTALLSTLMLTACGMLPHKGDVSHKPEKIQEPAKPAKQPKPEKTQEPVKPPEQPKQSATLTQQKIHQLLSEQDYAGAIDLIQEEFHKGVDDQALAEEYLQAANGSLILAESLTSQGYCSKAAILLKTVQDSYPKSLKLQQQIKASPVQIAERIDACTEKLMEAGLVAYRSGEFAAAIDIWQQVIEFNPQHQAAKDSIQTTERQLTNLKALDSKE